MVRFEAISFVVSALYLIALVNAAEEPTGSPSKYSVEGRVYCDTCRIQFITRVSMFLEGAKVRLECKNTSESEKTTFSGEAVTDKDGKYNIPVSGDFENNKCQIVLLQSPMKDCSEIPHDTYTKLAASISLTSHNGVVDPTRHANPLGFFRKTALPECPQVLKEIGLNY